MKTRKGIYTNSNERDYFIRFKNLTFYFSSQYYKDKFTTFWGDEK